MSAPVGNQFWKLRTKHGKDSMFNTPSVLWAAACEYFEWVTKNPLMSVEFNGKDAKRCQVPKMRAMTIKALCLFLGMHEKYFFERKDKWVKCKDKKKLALREEFLEVFEYIENVIYVQKFEGAAAGLLSPTIIIRQLGLIDKTEQKLDAKVNSNTTVSGKVEIIHKASGVPLGNDPYDGTEGR